MVITSGCIFDSDDDCTCPTQALVYISVAEGQGQSSATYDNEKGLVDSVIVFIYDKESKLHRIVKLTREEIENRTPIEITIRKGSHPQVVVWGNLEGAEEVSKIVSGQMLSSPSINMRQNGDYATPTDNLYYGYKVLTDENVQEVKISTWVGRVSITARGIENLTDSTSHYYYIIESAYAGYDFYGRPLAGNVSLKVNAHAEANQQEELLVHQPINLVAYPTTPGSRQPMKIKLYKKTPDGDVLITQVNMDNEGNKIITHPGENTNILIDFSDNANLNVYFKLTPWEQIYQWAWW